MKLIKVLCLIFFLYGTNCSAQEVVNTIYVSPSGNDTWSGKINTPLLTINKALQKISLINGSEGHIILRAGTYPINSKIEIGNYPNFRKLIISNYRDEKVILSGGFQIPTSSVKKTTDLSILKRLSKLAKDHIYEVNLKELGITNYGELVQHGHRNAVPAPLEFFYNDQAMVLARWPNNDYLPIGRVIESGITNKKIGVNKGGATFQYSSDRPSNWSSSNQIWIAGFFANGFANDNLSVQSIDVNKKQVTLSKPTNYGVKSTIEATAKGASHSYSYRRFYFYNVLEELDTSGEWYLDRIKGILYFYSSKIINSDKLFVSICNTPIFSLINSNGITVSGLQFAYGRDMGIYAQGTKNVTIENCVFKNLGTLAIGVGKNTADKKLYKSYEQLISFDNTTGFSIKSCKIFNTGTGGVFLTGGNRQNLIPAHNYIKNTEIYNYARRNLVSCPAVFLGGVGNAINNCYIHDSEGQAIMYWGNNHDISYNKIKGVVKEISDQGAVYTGRDPSSTGTKIHNNFFTHILSSRGYSIAAVYIDDGSGGIQVDSNIFSNCNSSGQYKFGAIHINGGGDNTFNNNYFINCKVAVSMTSWTDDKWRSVLGSNEMKQKLTQDVQLNSAIFLKQYPFLNKFASDNFKPGINTFTNTLLVNVSEFGPNAKSIIQKNSKKSVSNPGFVDINNNNFRISSKNAIFNQNGIKYIDFSKIGIKN